MTDSIERTILIAAPIERVWDIVTTPEHMGRWFGDAGAERDGDVIKMRWAEHGEAELRTDADEQARLREGNVRGWKHELGDLERYAQTVAV